MSNPVKKVCVFCGSAAKAIPTYGGIATDVGRTLVAHGYEVVFGGGRVGLMGIVADAMLGAGGKVHGVIPEFMKIREVAHHGLTRLDVVETMHERKQIMADNADAFLILPGGLGTLDETFEILTWKLLGLHNKPVLILNEKGFWQPLLNLINHIIEEQFATADSHHLYRVVDCVADLPKALATPDQKQIDVTNKWFDKR
jgi:uncharacterized protein (TIGR00730 family)